MNKDWLKKLSNISATKGVDPSKVEITPFRDWRIIVATFFVSLLLSIGFNVYMSIEINRDNFFTTPVKSTDMEVFNKDGLASVLRALGEKEGLFEKARTERVIVADPSL